MRVSSCAEFHEIIAVFNYKNLEQPSFPKQKSGNYPDLCKVPTRDITVKYYLSLAYLKTCAWYRISVAPEAV